MGGIDQKAAQNSCRLREVEKSNGDGKSNLLPFCYPIGEVICYHFVTQWWYQIGEVNTLVPNLFETCSRVCDSRNSWCILVPLYDQYIMLIITPLYNIWSIYHGYIWSIYIYICIYDQYIFSIYVNNSTTVFVLLTSGIFFAVVSEKHIFRGKRQSPRCEAQCSRTTWKNPRVPLRWHHWRSAVQWLWWKWRRIYIYGCVWKCCVPLNPMVLLIIIPIKWLFHWEYTLFSDKPICHLWASQLSLSGASLAEKRLRISSPTLGRQHHEGCRCPAETELDACQAPFGRPPSL